MDNHSRYATQPNTCNTVEPSQSVLALLRNVGITVGDYAEIGIYEGDTTVEAEKLLPLDTKMHLFDYQDRCELVKARLKSKHRVILYGSDPTKLFDSYNWGLGKALANNQRFDFVFIDGAHTWHHDALAFLLVDRMLVRGGWVVFDDLGWSHGTSLTQNPDAYEKTGTFYTAEQIAIPQVSMVVDLLVKPDSEYKQHAPGVFQKVGRYNDVR